MKRVLKIAVISASVLSSAFAQTKTDSVQSLKEVVVTSYFSARPVLKSPASVSIVDQAQLRLQPPATLVSTINSVPGVRMEERSPGSYRLSIRGSLLRSPFGIRNVKMYLGDFPLTDASGNTYLNLLDPGAVNRLEILKGPEASIFGANSGGVILINPQAGRVDSTELSATLTGGSYGLFNERVGVGKRWNNYSLNVSQAYQRSDGYRQNSGLNRNYADLFQRWKYSGRGELRALVLYSDLNYQTPGGLTAQQMAENPRSARPKGALPGAVEQRAAIYNKTVLGGISNEIRLTSNLRHVIAVYGSHTDFRNPFITNYEQRSENTLGVRTFLEYKTKQTGLVNFQWQVGAEAAKTASDISNYDNEGGQKGNVQSSDRVDASQSFLFSHASADIGKWLFEVAASLNYYKYKYGNLLNEPLQLTARPFEKQLMPRFAVSYQFNDNFSWRGSASKGYSPPTIAEVRASDNLINTDLQAEKGWNYESGIRFRSTSDRVYFDLSAFDFRLKDAIVRRLNENDTEYFVNAGGTKQQGVEAQLMAWFITPRERQLVRGLQWRTSYAYSHFRFSDYQNASNNYSGNRLTGVPANALVNSFDLLLPAHTYLFAQNIYTSRIPLNDDNSAFAKAYNLLQLKAGWRLQGRGNLIWDLFAGADNLLNENYSLGNDLNAFGGRYFNPAPLRNFYAGLALRMK